MGSDAAPPASARTEGRYSNSFRVGYNAFEFLLDFGQEYAEDASGVIHTRIIIMPSYAKALSELLAHSLRQYEDLYGAIPDAHEYDEEKKH